MSHFIKYFSKYTEKCRTLQYIISLLYSIHSLTTKHSDLSTFGAAGITYYKCSII